MSDTRPVPTNLDGWPGVTDLVVPYKHLLHVLWSSPSSLVSVIGVGRPGIIEHLTSAARQDEPVILEALRELHRRSLVVLDEQTREVAVRRWCRFHTFPGRWAIQARIAYDKIESTTIKSVLVKHEGVNAIFPEKSKDALPNSNCNNNCNEVAAAPRAPARGTGSAAALPLKEKRRTKRASGIVTWTTDDLPEADRLEQQYSADLIDAAVSALLSANKEPVPGLVAREIERQHREYLAAEQRAVTAQRMAAIDALDVNPVAIARGAELFPSISKRLRSQHP